MPKWTQTELSSTEVNGFIKLYLISAVQAENFTTDELAIAGAVKREVRILFLPLSLSLEASGNQASWDRAG